MAEATVRYGLQLLQTGQAQKEITHNEALLRADVLLHAAAQSRSLAAPPGNPGDGLCWIVASGATGDWSYRAGELACAGPGGWRFVSPREGMLVWVADEGLFARFGPYGWVFGDWTASALLVGGQKVVGGRGAAVADPAGGTTVDSEARATLSVILERLREHGLIDG